MADGAVSLRGLKENAKGCDEMILDVNTDYLKRHGGYKFTRERRKLLASGSFPDFLAM